VQFAGLGKGDARKRSGKNKGEKEVLYVLEQKGNMQYTTLSYDQADHLLTTIRDEAHRFANAYRKKQMSKEWS
jgi:excinuclease UvrABC nuclease subunit